MFDAGAIEARLTINLSQFNRDMSAAEARVKRFEDEKHVVKVSAVFDNASLSKAKKAFADLDNQISREAMQRLRSSPQGSVLGSLNALFSPHPVTGGPSASQAAANGLLGKMIQAPGGGGPTVLASGNNSSTRGTSTVGQVLGLDDAQVRAQAQKAGRDAADAASNAASDEAKRRGSGWFGGLLAGIGGSVGAIFNRHGSSGTAGPVNNNSSSGIISNTLGGIGPGVAGIGALKATGIGLGASALGALPALFGGLAPLIPGVAGAGALGLLFKGAQTSLSPLSQLAQTIQTTQATPGLTAAQQQTLAQQQAQLASGVAALSPQMRSIFNSEQQIGNWWQNFSASFAPMFAGPLSALARMITGLTGPLTQFFGQAFKLAEPLIGGLGDIVRQILPGLAQGFAAAAPVIRPLLDGLGALVGNFLPGLNTLIKASAPAVKTLAGVFGTLGSDLGQMLAVFAPVLSQSDVIFKALFDVIGALLPIIGKLAGIFATALAPVFLQFSQVIQALLPFLTIVGKVLASLAGAVIGDLVSAFGAIATLLKAVAPSLATFATAISGVFTVLENNDVFSTLGNAVEALAKPLATVIDSLLKGLTPLLPPLIKFIAQLSTILAAGLAAAIIQLLPPLTQLANTALASLAQLLPVILPLLVTLAGVFTTATVAVVGGIADALSHVASAISPGILSGIALGILGIVGALKLWQLGVVAVTGATKLLTAIQAIWAAITDTDTIALKILYGWDILVAAAEKAWAVIQAILNIALDANPIGAIVLAVAALAAGIYELYTHWGTVWGFIKHIAEDAWNFIFNGIGKYLLPLLGPAGVIVLAVIEVYKHWQTIWGALKQFIIGDFVAPVVNAILTMVGTVINGVADAFGWIPGLGGKLHDAANSFNTFKDNVNQALANITKSVNVDLTTSGSGSIVISGTGITTRTINTSTGQIHTIGGHTYKGAYITTGAGPTTDDNMAMVARGELIVPAHLVRAGMANNMRGLIPGFSAGGIIGTPIQGAGDAIGNADATWAQLSAVVFAQSALKAAAAAQAAAASAGPISLGNLSASSGYQAFVQVANQIGWGAALLQDWVNVEMREAGFSLTATNPTSGAYGMAQFINGPSEYYQYGGNPNTYIGQAVAMANYILQRYGNPAGAWAHEQAFNWYGNGGWITEPVIGYGMNSGQRYVLGERGPELVTPAGKAPWGGGSGFQLADTINLMLPEGTTLAEAFTELSWQLRVQQMQQNWRPHG